MNSCSGWRAVQGLKSRVGWRAGVVAPSQGPPAAMDDTPHTERSLASRPSPALRFMLLIDDTSESTPLAMRVDHLLGEITMSISCSTCYTVRLQEIYLLVSCGGAALRLMDHAQTARLRPGLQRVGRRGGCHRCAWAAFLRRTCQLHATLRRPTPHLPDDVIPILLRFIVIALRHVIVKFLSQSFSLAVSRFVWVEYFHLLNTF